jgi:catechol 2,3-dioxygenase-like lactoylglutathione lyase family enzyme
MAIQRIESVTYGVTDVAECVRFFKDFGLTLLDDSSPREAVLETVAGQEIRLRHLQDPSLPLPFEEGPGIREVIWGVDTQQALDTLVAELSTDREVRIEHGIAHTLDESGFGIGFAMARPKPLDFAPRKYNSTGNVTRINDAHGPILQVHPLRICHVAMNIPKEGREKAVAFYLDRLNFRATDIVEPMGVFMQAEGDLDQHTFLLCHRPDRAGTNHTSYEVPGFDDVIEGGNQMIDKGWREARKLGRHTVGSNVFRFIHAPCGGRVEYAADMDRADENYETKVHEQAPPHHIWALKSNRNHAESESHA